MKWTQLFKVDLADKDTIESWSCRQYAYAVDPKTGMLWTRKK